MTALLALTPLFVLVAVILGTMIRMFGSLGEHESHAVAVAGETGRSR